MTQGNDMRVIHIWDHSSNAPQYVLKHEDNVYWYEWSPCERWIATGSKCAVWLWYFAPNKTVMEWSCTLIIRDFVGYVHSISWRPNSLELVTGCEDGSVRAWRLVEISGIWSAQLIWSTGNNVLAASGVKFSNAVGLSASNRRLLEQR
ncbi:hypothetical protein FBU30_000057, partial [Linnemannia zychae]